LIYLFEELKYLNKEYFIIIQFKIKIDNNNIRSISYLQTIKLKEYNDLIDIFIYFWNIKRSYYISIPVIDIIFTYRIMSNNNGIITSSKFNIKKENKNIIHFKGYNLPNNMNCIEWG